MSFRDLVIEQLAAARDAATANDVIGRPELAEWWRWRVRDLEDYLRDAGPSFSSSAAA
jgi:hypothetical protein